MRKINKWDIRYLQLARLISTWSKDTSTKTGAVIVASDNSIISVGFNGFPKRMPDNIELYKNREHKLSRIIHCEINALMFAARKLPPGSVLYTWPFLSCDRCAVQMIQAGIETFISPKATYKQSQRWEESFKKSRQYIEECGCGYIEIPRNQLNAKVF